MPIKSATTRCVSSQAAAIPAALEKLVQDVRTYRVANLDVTLDVSGSGSEAVAKNLQEIDASKVTVTKGPGDTKAGTVVVAKKAGVAVAQFSSFTSIVPVVQPLSPYEVAVRKVSIVTTSGVKIVKSRITSTGTNFGDLDGAAGVWVSHRAHAVCSSSISTSNWLVHLLNDDNTGRSGQVFNNADNVPSLDQITSVTMDGIPNMTLFTWTGTPPSSIFPVVP